jgi:hypothetical protein
LFFFSFFHELCFLVIRFCFIQNLNLRDCLIDKKKKGNVFYVLLDILDFMRA